MIPSKKDLLPMNTQFHMICLSSKNQEDKKLLANLSLYFCLQVKQMDSYSEQVNQYSADVGHSDQLLETKIQNEQLKNELKCMKESVEEIKSVSNDLKESHDNLLKKVNDLETLVISQNQNKAQHEQRTQSNSNSENVGNNRESNFENPFCFEQPLKKIKLEDQSEDIQRLNQVIKDLKEENQKLSNENTRYCNENAMLTKDYEEMQIHNETVVKNLKAENLILSNENTKISMENTTLCKQNQEMKKQNVANNQAKKDLKKYNLKLSKKNANLFKDIHNLEIKLNDLERRIKEHYVLESKNSSS